MIQKTKRLIKNWVMLHIGQVLLFALGVAGLSFTYNILVPFFKVYTISIGNGIYYHDEDGNCLTKVKITIEKQRPKDIYRLAISLNNKSKGLITIRLPEGFKRLPDKSLSQYIKFVESWERDKQIRFSYKIISSSNGVYNFWEEYEANIFDDKYREINYRSLIEFFSGKEVPVEIWIRGLEGAEVFNISPKPKFSNDFALGFSFNKRNKETYDKYGSYWSSVEFDLFDRHKSYKRDHTILICGALIGVFSSLITSVLVGLVQNVETRLRENRMHNNANSADAKSRAAD